MVIRPTGLPPSEISKKTRGRAGESPSVAIAIVCEEEELGEERKEMELNQGAGREKRCKV
jgi:hypothetical protein